MPVLLLQPPNLSKRHTPRSGHGQTLITTLVTTGPSTLPNPVSTLQAGAQLVDTHAAVFDKANLIVKVKEPVASEYPLVMAHHTVFTFFHLAGSRELTETMMKTG